MAQNIPIPEPHALITPLLAFLPVSFASSRPPSEFLPLLSPILRQRIHISTTVNPSASAQEKWTRLLCWDPQEAEKLNEVIEEASFEPHPSSGELEVGDIEPTTYRRLDEETLKAQIPLPDWQLTAFYLWCENDEGSAWKLTELTPYDFDLARDPAWSSSIAQANDRVRPRASVPSIPHTEPQNSRLFVPSQNSKTQVEEDDDDYWAQYDKSGGATPGGVTPARKPSIVPNGTSHPQDQEDAYYAQYSSVQPAADSYDPDEEHEQRELLGQSQSQSQSYSQSRPQPQPQSTLDSDNIMRLLAMNGIGAAPAVQPSQLQPQPDHSPVPPSQPHTHPPFREPSPSSPRSRTNSETVSHLERTAQQYSASEVAIKQHISTSIKSMFRLARGAGMSREEFEELVGRELETLSLLDRED